ncbi:YhgE/Pip domain-containing protein [Bacillus sp. 2205SS5-2]|uniref:YhgE/Pip domain-containing protein n=1 Tax=Bacillus sp. 2205SS5-2 TaxID=3109031 RepID=UPI0030060559
MKKSLLYAELRDIILNRKVLIPVIAVLFIPILYSGMFLWAFWDPYEGLDDLPVAIVNNDLGADFDGEPIQLGDELVKELKKSQEFAFKFVDEEQGNKGLQEQDYYLLVEIPEDFSESATTLLEENPQKLSLNYVPNEGYNFLSAQIGETAMKEIKASLSTTVTETYAESMFDKIRDLGDGLTEAEEGSGKLSDGANTVSEGALTLKEKLVILAGKSIEMKDGMGVAQNGANNVQKGASELSSGIIELNNKFAGIVQGTTKLKKGTEELQAGLVQSEEGLIQAEAGVEKIVSNTTSLAQGGVTLSKGAQQLNQGIQLLDEQITPLLASLPEEQRVQMQRALTVLKEGNAQVQGGSQSLSDNIGLLNNGQKKTLEGLNKLTAGARELSLGSDALLDGENQLLSGMEQYQAGLATANDGGKQLASGAKELLDGVNRLSSGSSLLSDGTSKIVDGSKELAEGTIDLSEGNKELNTKLGEAANEVNSVKADDKTYNQMGEPVNVDKEAVHPVPNYGTGFAPYFLSLGLFVGALLISIVYPLREPASRPKNAFSWFFSKFGVLTGVGILQSLIAVAILLIGLDIEVESVGLFVVSTIVTSLTFLALIQALVTILGDPGRFVAIIILILQLTTSAGTFPLELIPAALQPVSPLLPMTYSVSAFKAVISSGDFEFMWWNLGILATFMGGSMILTLGFFKTMHKRQFFKTVEQ